MYSALKHAGRPLYELARQGKTVARAPRDIVIHAFERIGGQLETPRFLVRCSKGTYIRTLIEDLGNRLGCGAHVTELRRIGMRPFGRPVLIDLEQLTAAEDRAQLDDFLLPMDRAVEHLPSVVIDAAGCVELGHGRCPVAEMVCCQSVAEKHGDKPRLVRLYGPQQEFLGIGRYRDDGRIQAERLLREVSIQ